MTKFKVTVVETAEYTVEIEAETVEEAEERSEQYVIDHLSIDDASGICCDVIERVSEAEELNNV